MRTPSKVLRVQAILHAAVVSAVLAQGTTTPSAKLTVELETRQRWMNARQLPIHTPRVTTTHLISVDSIVTDSAAAARVFWGRVGERRMIADPLRITTRLDGHLAAVDVTPRQSPGLPMMRTARDSARMARFGLVDFTGVYLTLPAARAWDVVPVYRGRRLRAGERWIDTLSYATTVRDMQQSMAGRRTYTIVRDTTIAARHLWIVRDSAAVDLTERYPIDERRLDSLATIERRVRGFVVGQWLYDPEIGLFRVRRDSTALRGEATLTYPDGRVFKSPTRFERVRTWTVYEPDELARREAQLAAQRDSNSFSIVMVPRNTLEQHVRAGNRSTVDSLYAVWRSSNDPDQRDAIKRLLNMWGGRDSTSRARFRAARIAEGDTAYMLEGRDYDESPRISLRDVQFLLPFMRDPGLAFQHGLSRDIAYERMVETLIRVPPAIEPDTAKWLCEPVACDLLSQQWRTATEPRLKSVGLSVLALVNPRRWRDTFLIHAKAGDNVLQLALPIVDGAVRQGGLSLAARPNPVPPAGASWEAWRDWVRGPVVSPPPPLPSGRGALPPQPPRWLFSAGNSLHLRFLQVATGRDLVRELSALFVSAPSDSATVMIASILDGLNALPFGSDSIVLFATHANPLFRAFASRLVVGSFPSNESAVRFDRADSATNAVIQRQLLPALVAKREPWPSIEERTLGGGGAGPFREPPSDAPGARHPVYYNVDSVDTVVRAELAGRLTTMSGSVWSARSSREGGELWSISRVERTGRFARVRVDVSGRIQRAENQGPQAWFSWTTYYLVERDGEWFLLNKISAVT